MANVATTNSNQTVFVLCKNGTMTKGKNGIGPVFSSRAKLENALRDLADNPKAEIKETKEGLRIVGLTHYAGKTEPIS